MMKTRGFMLTACCLLLVASLACGLGSSQPAPEVAKPTAGAAAGAPTPEPTPVPPTAMPEEFEVRELPYQGPVPDGALARIGRGIASSMALSPDGESLVVGTTIGVYSYATATMTTAWYTPLSTPVVGTVFSWDGSRLAALTTSHITILDAATGEPIGERISNQTLDGVAVFSPDGTQLATANNLVIRLWNLATGEMAAELAGHAKTVMSLAWTPDGSQLVSGATAEDGETGEIFVWDVSAGEPVRQFGSEHSRAITALVFNSDGSRLLADAAKEAIIWDFAAGVPQNIIESTHFLSAAWSPDDALIAFGLTRGRTQVFDAANAAELYEAEDQRIDILNIAFSPDSSLLYTLDSDGTIYKRDAATGQPLKTAEGFAARLGGGVWSPDGETIWAGMSGAQIIHWNVNTFKQLHLHGDFGASGLIGPTIEALAYSPDFSLIAVGGTDGTIQLYDPASEQVVAAFGDRDTGHRSAVNRLGWSPDGTQIVSAGLDNNIVVWDVAAQAPLARFDDLFERPFGAVAFAPDGSAIVAGSWDDSIYVLDPASGTIRSQWNPELGDQSGLGWHPNNPSQFVTASMNVIIWDYTTGEPVLALDDAAGFNFPYAVAFSPDGALIAGGGSRGDVALWNAETGAVIAVYEGPHNNTVRAVAFSPDGTKFATISYDGTILIWAVP
jgi:WD40 repeat protein